MVYSLFVVILFNSGFGISPSGYARIAEFETLQQCNEAKDIFAQEKMKNMVCIYSNPIKNLQSNFYKE